MKEEKFLEKWEKESYEKGWKDGRKKLLEEIEEKNKLLVEGFLDDFKKGYIKPTELFNAYATHVEIIWKNLKGR
jgi:soluble cytochrome b562